MLPDALAAAIRESCGEALLLDTRRGAGIVSDLAQLHATCQRLRNLGFARCIDLTALHLDGSAGPLTRAQSGSGEKAQVNAHALPEAPSFQLYLLLRHPEHAHVPLQLKWKYTQTDESFHPSLSRIWPSAGLAERELWELLGIAFSGNDNLFPLLLDPQFEGWPLRRDYQLPQRESFGDRLLRERYESGLVEAISSATVSGRAVIQDAGTEARTTDGSGGGA